MNFDWQFRMISNYVFMTVELTIFDKLLMNEIMCFGGWMWALTCMVQLVVTSYTYCDALQKAMLISARIMNEYND